MARKSQESQKEMKLLLDVYKGLAKEQREKVEVCSNLRDVLLYIKE
jgi:hypothetical protein